MRFRGLSDQVTDRSKSSFEERREVEEYREESGKDDI